MSENQPTAATPPPEAAAKSAPPEKMSWVDQVIWFCLNNKLVVFLVTAFIVGWGVMVAPFDWDVGGFPRNPVAVDAIPDIGENQQIVFTEWEGRSPQDIDDQITYPLTTALLGIPGVKTVRSYSYFGYSTIFAIFEEKYDFYWTRSRVLEKLSSIPSERLPEGVTPMLGPDATPLGQVYWYTLEGRDPDGNPAGGWDPQELRTVQDWHVRYSLLSSGGVSEVASVGGFVKEYQIDVDPDAMRAFKVSLEDVFDAVHKSNVDVGARTIEVNRVEYLIRGTGFIKGLSDVEKTVVKVNENVPVRVRDIAKVSYGPEMRRGALNKEGAEAAGGIVIVRYAANPLEVIKNVKNRIKEIAPGLPTKPVIDYHRVTRTEVEQIAKAQGFEAYGSAEIDPAAWMQWLRSHERAQWPEWITTSQVTIIPYYDRTGLIYETLGTLNSAILEEVIITIIVIIVMVTHLRSSILISSVLPLAVLMSFIGMKTFGIDANIVSLSGIAIAIGTIVDMGIIICENILKHLDAADPKEDRLHVVFRASSEVGSAVLTAISTTVVSFLPVFTMIGAEGKLFKPLAFTKTFALAASVIVALTIIPALAHILLAGRLSSKKLMKGMLIALLVAGAVIALTVAWWAGLVIIGFSLYYLFVDRLPERYRKFGPWVANGVALLLVGIVLTNHWLPLGPDKGLALNLGFVTLVIGGLLSTYLVMQWTYRYVLGFFLAHKLIYLSMPVALVLAGLSAWLGFERVFGFIPAAAEKVGISQETIRLFPLWTFAAHKFPGFGKEFMPPLDEGSYLYMPTTMPHASVGEALEIIDIQDRAITAIPEVENVVGKVGRSESALDPAPMSMVETVITYKPEYMTDKDGRRLSFKFDREKNEFVRDDQGQLIPDPRGRPYRQWREHIQKPDDIWKEIVKAAQIPGTTSAPELQPIAARIVMLQSGMRAPMGVKVKGPDLATIEKVGLEIERYLKDVPSVQADAVIADRIVGSAYLEIDINREAIARYGLKIRDVQDVIEVALGGIRLTTTVEGRERYPVRVRYLRELRDQIETLGRILVPSMDGAQVPLAQLAEVRYVRGPMSIKSEDTFLIGYVLFDKKADFAEVDVVEDCQRYLQQKLASGEWTLPAGVSYSFAGSYENQIRAQKTLSIVIPVALFIIFLILYFQFSSYVTTLLVWSGLVVAASGGFLLLWLYGQPWFLNFSLFGVDMRELFQVHTINLSVAIWVGFLALFGIATDDGVVIATYLDQSFAKRRIGSIQDIRDATLAAGLRRIRPCLMTTATTVLALMPVLTSSGRGSDVMLPMAIPSFGGMTIEIVTLYLIPVLYCWKEETKFRFQRLIGGASSEPESAPTTAP
ncbi:MAG: efflux RND transporter permease subunit [Candidatus Hydrogenedentes bacterium]|nr:efflux RND transporter permease subunit [Candidatus Hydrogenedentota bacterium]